MKYANLDEFFANLRGRVSEHRGIEALKDKKQQAASSGRVAALKILQQLAKDSPSGTVAVDSESDELYPRSLNPSTEYLEHIITEQFQLELEKGLIKEDFEQAYHDGFMNQWREGYSTRQN